MALQLASDDPPASLHFQAQVDPEAMTVVALVPVTHRLVLGAVAVGVAVAAPQAAGETTETVALQLACVLLLALSQFQLHDPDTLETVVAVPTLQSTPPNGAERYPPPFAVPQVAEGL